MNIGSCVNLIPLDILALINYPRRRRYKLRKVSDNNSNFPETQERPRNNP